MGNSNYENRVPEKDTLTTLENCSKVIKFGNDDYIELFSEGGGGDVLLDFKNFNISWVSGEEAFKLGQALVDFGMKALKRDKTVLEHEIEYNKYISYIRDGRVEKVIFKKLYKDEPIFTVIPLWVDGREPKNDKDFCFNSCMEWPELLNEFKSFMFEWTRGLPYEFKGDIKNAQI